MLFPFRRAWSILKPDMNYGLENKVAVVTGAAHGIGAAVALAFCSEGARTVFVDIDEIGLDSIVKADNGLARACDISQKDQVQQLFGEIRKDLGSVDILVNSAAYLSAGYIQEVRDDDIDKTLEISIRGCLYTTAAVIPHMRQAGGGRIIYIGSSSGLKASAGLSLYSASKYFVRGLAIAAALEEGKHNITSNVICPSDVYPSGDLPARSWNNESLIRISLEKEGVSTLEELIESRNAINPMRRSCTADDVAQLALFLASEKAGYINGQSIGLNGGAVPY